MNSFIDVLRTLTWPTLAIAIVVLVVSVMIIVGGFLQLSMDGKMSPVVPDNDIEGEVKSIIAGAKISRAGSEESNDPHRSVYILLSKNGRAIIWARVLVSEDNKMTVAVECSSKAGFFESQLAVDYWQEFEKMGVVRDRVLLNQIPPSHDEMYVYTVTGNGVRQFA